MIASVSRVIKVRWLSVLLGLGTFLVLAAVGHVLGYLYLRHRGVGGSGLLDVFVGEQLDPWVGGVLADVVRLRGVVAWLLGLVTAVAVLALALVLTVRRGEPVTAVAGGWLGSILGTAAGGLVAMVAFLHGLGGRESFDVLGSREVLFGVMRGLYWGTAAGWLVGVAAALGARGRAAGEDDAATRPRELDSPPSPAR